MSRLAALIYQRGEDPDSAILSALPIGHGGAGYVQLRTASGGLALRNVATGQEISLGNDATRGCGLDLAALEAAAATLAQCLALRPRFLILNRFGDAEAAGDGVRPLLEAAVEANIPVLVPVAAARRDVWRRYGGELAEELACSPGAVGDWIARLE